MFITDLWDSIFTPGTSPALITATHGSFILLLASLLVLIYLTRSIHYINLFVISVILYGLVIWFIGELQQAKLQSNEELQKEGENQSKEAAKEAVQPEATEEPRTVDSETAAIRKRKT